MTTPPQPPGGDEPYELSSPLLPTDPPKIGDFWLDSRLLAAPSGVTYLAHDELGTVVMLVLLSSGAAEDAAARDRLAGQVNAMHIDTVVARGGQGQHEGRLAHKFRSEDDDPVAPGQQPLAPWVALAYDGTSGASAEAQRLLDEVMLFLHQVVEELPEVQQQMIKKARSREAALEIRRCFLLASLRLGVRLHRNENLTQRRKGAEILCRS